MVPPAALLAGLGGCQNLGSLAGGVVGAATGAGTSNPVVGYAVGVGTKAAVDEVMKYIGRNRQGAEQDAIAAQVGSLPIGQSAPWKIEHTIPLGNENGEVTVVREIRNPLGTCREAAFSVIDGDGPDARRAFYVTTACLQDGRWKWAQAEPAVLRWGFLQ